MNDLVIAAAQSASLRGNLDANIANHLRFIDAAASAGVQLIVFPELSLTGYELDLGRCLQLQQDDPRLEPLRSAAIKHNMHVLASGPWASGQDRPFLGAFVLSSEQSVCYAKIHVHISEEEYFMPGKQGCIISIGSVPTGIAICADASQAAHPAAAAAQNAQLYVVSVMKTEDEYPAHAHRLQHYAAQHRMAVLTANYAGSTGGQVSAGKSAIWDDNGQLIAQADSNGEALVVARRDHGTWRGEVITDL